MAAGALRSVQPEASLRARGSVPPTPLYETRPGATASFYGYSRTLGRSSQRPKRRPPAASRALRYALEAASARTIRCRRAAADPRQMVLPLLEPGARRGALPPPRTCLAIGLRESLMRLCCRVAGGGVAAEHEGRSTDAPESRRGIRRCARPRELSLDRPEPFADAGNVPCEAIDPRRGCGVGRFEIAKPLPDLRHVLLQLDKVAPDGAEVFQHDIGGRSAHARKVVARRRSRHRDARGSAAYVTRTNGPWRACDARERGGIGPFCGLRADPETMRHQQSLEIRSYL